MYFIKISKLSFQNDYTEKFNLELERSRDLKVKKNEIIYSTEACVLRKEGEH